MKFFKQTKETKRKISFFMALAMIISLLPVSPYAKVTTKSNTDPKVTVNCTVEGVTSAAVEKKTGTNVSGAVIITLTADSGYIFDTNSKIYVSTGPATEGSNKKETVTITTNCAVSGSSIGTNNNSVTVSTTSALGSSSSSNTYEITVSNINSDITVTITGNASEKKPEVTPTPTITPTTEPTETPTKAPTATPTVTPTKNPAGTATPKPTFKVKILKGTLGENIDFTATSDNEDVTVKTDGTEFNAVAGTKITLAVKPTTVPDKKFRWVNKPVLAVTSGAIKEENAEWKQTDGSLEYTYVIMVDKDKEVSVSGGSVMDVPTEAISNVANSIPTSAPVLDENGNESNVTVGINTPETEDEKAAVLDAVINALVQGSTTASITTEDKIYFDDDKGSVEVSEVLAELAKENGNASIKTEVKVQIASNSFTSTATSTSSIASSANKDNIEAKDDKGNTTTISLEDNEVKSMLTSGDVYDITVESILTMGKGNDAKTATVKVENLGGAIKITMSVPKKAIETPCDKDKVLFCNQGTW